MKHISATWSVFSAKKLIDFLLDDRNLFDLRIISALSEDRKKTVERNLENKCICSLLSILLVIVLTYILSVLILSSNARKLVEGARKRMVNKGKDEDNKKKKIRIPQASSLIKGGKSSDVGPLPKHTKVVSFTASVSITSAYVPVFGSLPLDAIPLHVSSNGPLEVSVVLVEESSVGDKLEDLYAHDSKISSNYFINPLATEFNPNEKPITPETGVEFMCSYGKNMLRSRAMGNLLEMEKKYEGKRESYKKAANRTIKGMKDDNTVDLFLAFDEFYDIQTENFDRAMKVIKEMLLRSYPEFDFRVFDTKFEVNFSDNDPTNVSSDDDRFDKAVRAEEASGKGKGTFAPADDALRTVAVYRPNCGDQ
ncbi:hypothetical protein Ddye_019334 [Dipteronia dyeriana]|uniref:Uncharacterized protein n=1 Tax=Dipteronia dyeriana TaxID=168575 RepID=A0AAD9TXK9_9ROSI|nr:hypothetical protein Ddye_019334 [Dipteronia dyeriana]